MHPAYSVIFFTTASGAGFGLLALLAVLVGSGITPLGAASTVTGFGLAFALIVGGLVSSSSHLGHKERAWRAFSQWRSSWLSREAVLACLTFLPATSLALLWLLTRHSGLVSLLLGFSTATLCLATVFATAMIYACLKPVAQWNTPLTAPAYILFALASGGSLLNAVLQAGDRRVGATPIVAVVLLCAAGFFLKRHIWACNDRAGFASTINEAVGVGDGSIRSVEWPHTEANYLLKEMGFRVARKHGERLRLIASALAFVAPAGLLLLACLETGTLRLLLSLAAPAFQLPGLLVERWLFFAEAKHTVSLYYGIA